MVHRMLFGNLPVVHDLLVNVAQWHSRRAPTEAQAIARGAERGHSIPVALALEQLPRL